MVGRSEAEEDRLVMFLAFLKGSEVLSRLSSPRRERRKERDASFAGRFDKIDSSKSSEEEEEEEEEEERKKKASCCTTGLREEGGTVCSCSMLRMSCVCSWPSTEGASCSWRGLSTSFDIFTCLPQSEAILTSDEEEEEEFRNCREDRYGWIRRWKNSLLLVSSAP